MSILMIMLPVKYHSEDRRKWEDWLGIAVGPKFYRWWYDQRWSPELKDRQEFIVFAKGEDALAFKLRFGSYGHSNGSL